MAASTLSIAGRNLVLFAASVPARTSSSTSSFGQLSSSWSGRPAQISSLSAVGPLNLSHNHSRKAIRRISKSSTTVVAASENGSSANGGASREFDYDLFTIGAGSGGVRGTRFAAQYGAKAAVCELPFNPISSDSTGGVGGTCVLRGCVPKKLLVYASEFPHDFESSHNFGWQFPAAPTHDWPTLIRNKNKELERLTGVYRSTLDKAGVELIEGRGKLVDRHTVEVNGKRYTARHILIAVGGRATVPNLPGREYVVTSDEALELPQRPDKIVIVGGGYIALEFACIFRGIGSEVHVVVRQPLILRGFDQEVREFLQDKLKLQGIQFHVESTPTAVEKDSSGRLTVVTDKGERIDADTVMFGTGRSPNTKNLGLEVAGVEINEKGAIQVDEYSRTSVDNIWAVGDVTNRVNLTPVALMEGGAFAKTVFNNQPTKPFHKNVPSAVFTQPQIATVGLNEEQAIEELGDVDVYTSSFRSLKATISGLPDKTLMKIIVDPHTDKVLGVHMCGDDSAEILQGIAIAVRAGCTKEDFDTTVGIHPTAAEEFVTMRSPTRQHREKEKQQSKATAEVAGAR